LWLVWLMDHRSQALKDSHSQVIRNLATYLRVVCGIDVALDLFEEKEVLKGVSSWMQSSHEKSQFVVLICPHYSYAKEAEPDHSSFFGDFDKSFKYLEPFFANKVKYITANLPYSDPDCCDGAKWLHNMTTKYSLMDQIEDFYFHVQGCSNFALTGKRTAEFIDHKNFMKTAEGVHLQQSIERFTLLQQKYLNGEKVLHDDVINDVTDQSTNFIDIADEDRRELHVQEMKVKRPSIETTVEICDEDDLEEDFYSGPPLILQPLSPLVNDEDGDPEEMLKLLNNAL